MARTGTRVTMVEDHALFAEAISIALEMEGHTVKRVPLTGQARSALTLLPTILRTNPRIVLLDLDLGTFGNGLHLVEPLVSAGVAVVVVTGSDERPRWGEAMAGGARLVLPKSSALNDILAAVRRIHEGLPVISPEDRQELLKAWQNVHREGQIARQKLERLTRRESEVLGHLHQGRQVREIAQRSYVSEATVRTQVKSVLTKLEVSSQIAAVGVAHQAGWTPPREVMDDAPA